MGRTVNPLAMPALVQIQLLPPYLFWEKRLVSARRFSFMTGRRLQSRWPGVGTAGPGSDIWKYGLWDSACDNLITVNWLIAKVKVTF